MEISELDDTFIIEFDMKFVKPFPLCYIAHGIKEFIAMTRKRKPDITFQVRYKPGQNGFSYASNMGFFKFISKFLDLGKMPGELLGSQNYLPIKLENFITKKKEKGIFLADGEVAEIIAEELSTVLIHDNEDLKYLYNYVLRELIRNIPEHSNCDMVGYAAQYWPRLKLSEICVFDEGCGIYDSLKSNSIHTEYIEANINALEYALAPGISERFAPGEKNHDRSEWANSGYGLYFISEICRILKGSLLIVSGENYIYQKANGKRMYGEAYYKGTIVRISLPSIEAFNVDSMLYHIREEAEIIAKSFDNTYHNASKSSSIVKVKCLL
ncbi:hypothetical protein [uncultured Veillonella sp.]|uniref:hypothetical protein n=1 Tax=uncultured Veillonella sp. TaxID=159268 RepID=UPI0025F01137|nr:hypothetical protein [uncultured Veillonella sp.]